MYLSREFGGRKQQQEARNNRDFIVNHSAYKYVAQTLEKPQHKYDYCTISDYVRTVHI